MEKLLKQLSFERTSNTTMITLYIKSNTNL